MHHSSNIKSAKKRQFYRIIVKFIFAHTALFAHSVMLCNRYPAIRVCKKCAKMCRRAKQSPMDKSTTGFMAGFRTSEQTPFDIEMRFTMNKLLSCRFNMDTNRVEARFEDGTTLAIDCIQNHRVLRFDMYTLFLQERSRTLVCTVVAAAFFKSRTTQKVTYRIAGGGFPDNEHKGRWFNLAGNQVIRFDFGHERIELGHIGEQIELLFQYFFQPHQCQQTWFHILLIECALLYLVIGDLIRQNHINCLAWTIAGQGDVFQVVEPSKVREVLW